MASKMGAEIHRLLAEGQPPEYVGRQVSAVYVHRAGRCQCPERAVVDPPSIDSVGYESSIEAAVDAILGPTPDALPIRSLERLPALPTEPAPAPATVPAVLPATVPATVLDAIRPVPSVAAMVQVGMSQEVAESCHRTWTEKPETWAKWDKELRKDADRKARKAAH